MVNSYEAQLSKSTECGKDGDANFIDSTSLWETIMPTGVYMRMEIIGQNTLSRCLFMRFCRRVL